MSNELAIQPPDLQGVQGESEQRTEAYMKYAEGAAELSTRQSTKSTGGATGFASWQAGAVRRL